MTEFQFIENIDHKTFNSLVNKPNIKTHFLGTWEWGEISKKQNWIPHYVGVLKNGELVATALMLQKMLFFGYSYFYIPRGYTMNYDDSELLEFLTESIKNYCKKNKAIFFKIDFDIILHTIDLDGNIIEGENNYQLLEKLKSLGYKHYGLTYNFETEQPRFTFRIPLNGTAEEVIERFSRTTKNNLKTATNRGVEIYIGDPNDLDKFNHLMEITEKRQNFYSHDKDFFNYCYEVLHNSDMADLYFARVNIPELLENLYQKKNKLEEQYDQVSQRISKKAQNQKRNLEEQLKPIREEIAKLENIDQETLYLSTYMNIHYGDKTWTLYGGNDMDYKKFYGNYLVYEKQILDALERGHKYFDGFGTPGRLNKDGKYNGLFEFKKKWGGNLTEFIGEFDYIINKPLYLFYKKAVPLYYKIRYEWFNKDKTN